MEKNQPPQLNINDFSKEKLSHHIQKTGNQGFHTHQRSIQIPNWLTLQEKGNMASPVDAAVSPSILYISECALDFMYSNDIKGSGLVKHFRFTSRVEFVVNKKKISRAMLNKIYKIEITLGLCPYYV